MLHSCVSLLKGKQPGDLGCEPLPTGDLPIPSASAQRSTASPHGMTYNASDSSSPEPHMQKWAGVKNIDP